MVSDVWIGGMRRGVVGHDQLFAPSWDTAVLSSGTVGAGRLPCSCFCSRPEGRVGVWSAAGARAPILTWPHTGGSGRTTTLQKGERARHSPRVNEGAGRCRAVQSREVRDGTV